MRSLSESKGGVGGVTVGLDPFCVERIAVDMLALRRVLALDGGNFGVDMVEFGDDEGEVKVTESTETKELFRRRFFDCEDVVELGVEVIELVVADEEEGRDGSKFGVT